MTKQIYIMTSRLTQETLKIIKKDAELFAKLSINMKVQPDSLAVILRRNSKRLTEHSILKVIADHTGKTTEDLVEEITEDSTK